MKVHEGIDARIKWFSDLYKKILSDVKDVDIAKAIFKTICFEENLK